MTLDVLAAVDDRSNTPERKLAVITLRDRGEIGWRQNEDGGHAAVTLTPLAIASVLDLSQTRAPIGTAASG